MNDHDTIPATTNDEMEAAWKSTHPECDRETAALAALAERYAKDPFGVTDVVAALAWLNLRCEPTAVEDVYGAVSERFCRYGMASQDVSDVLGLLLAADMVDAETHDDDDGWLWVEFEIGRDDLVSILRLGARRWLAERLPYGEP